MTFFLACLLVFTSSTRSSVFEEHDGEEIMERVVHFHRGNRSIPATDLSAFLQLISNQTGADGKLQADPKVSLFFTLAIRNKTAAIYVQHPLFLYTAS